jgi:GNAT superfamily N-acetyltransferase
MASLFAEYWREKGHLIIETERGFMSAIIHGPMCYVDNFYVKPEYRGTGSALQLTLQTIQQAKERGCTDLSAEVYKSDPLYTYILGLHKHFGMGIVEDTEFKTVTSKRI